jgi:preprotein translocase subunit SecG
MTNVLIIFHLFVTIALIGIVLIQRSEGGGLGIGSSQGMGGLMSGRGTANLLTRATAVLATLFMGIALVLALLDRGAGSSGRGLLDLSPPPAATALPGPPAKGVTLPAAPAPTTPAPGTSTPAKPAAPPVPTN